MNVRTLGYWLVSRERKRSVTTVVLHATAGGSALSSIGWLRHLQRNNNPKDDASYHFVIEDDGTVYKCVPGGKVAYHAGISVGPEGSNVNEYSIGIAFAHSNTPSEGYTEKALNACALLILELRKQFPQLTWVTTHYAITVKADKSYRKSDPINFQFMQRVAGALTPWKPSFATTYALFQ